MNIILFSSQAEESIPSAQIATMQPLEESFSYSRNAGVYKIATEMRNLGHAVEVIDFLVYWSDDDIKNLLNDRIPYVDVVGWSAQFFFNFNFYKKWCEYIKQIKSNIVFIAGGPKVTNLLNFTESKYLIAGYAEHAIQDILDHIEKKSNNLKFTLVNGAYYVDCAVQYKSDKLPNMVIDYHPSDYLTQHETLTLGTSRGCIFKCLFCTYPHIGKKKHELQREGAQTYYDELLNNYEKWGITNYYLSDETANDDIDKFLDLREALQNLPFKIDLTGFARLELLASHRDRWQLYKDIGFTNFHFGVETFNPAALKTVGKGYPPEKLQNTLIELRDYFRDDVFIFISLIVGLPNETLESFDELTLNWINTKGKDVINGRIIYPLDIHRESPFAVGSEFSRNYMQYGYEEMSEKDIEIELSLDPRLTIEKVHATSKYNILWKNQHWNTFTAERFAESIGYAVEWNTNCSVWTRARALSVGIPNEDIIRLAKKSNILLRNLFLAGAHKYKAQYIKNKLSKNWFET
jgi:radical SAM superfamily enzyme YgiQ (UPF0313 family)